MKPVLNKASEKLILATIKNMPQSLLITGPIGVGLTTAARYIAQMLDIKPTIILPEKDEKIDLEKGNITVDIMRQVLSDTRTKSSKDQIIIIDYAERMTQQAQNAFLKLLEEPNQGTYFILVSNSSSKLLPTILSRVKKIAIRTVSLDQSNELLEALGIKDKTKCSQLLFMASGLPAELSRLSKDNDYFEKRSNNIRDARELLQGKLYRKLLIAQKYKEDRRTCLVLLNDVMRILKHSIDNNPDNEVIKKIDIILKTYERIEAGGNIRICLARMVI
ncbi:MAG: AAA family ATPase [Candidatus Saccharibacteria bacterium]